MPLPTSNMTWPPRSVNDAAKLYRQWGAWYQGDPDTLAQVYGGHTSGGGGVDLAQYNRPSQYRGGVVGKVARWFWGAPLSAGQLTDSRLHMPLASDIAVASADLLFAEPPQFMHENEATKKRLDKIAESLGWHARLLEWGELCAAHGDVFLRASVDPDVAQHPLVDAIMGDAAVPEWRSGFLSAVTFWAVLHRDDAGQVWRHLERHEPRSVYHGLYRGTDDKLGHQRPLADHPTTEPFAKLVNEEGGISTGIDGLAVVHVPNRRPNRDLRGSPLGRSDYAGAVMGTLDALDETWSSWMRDIRLAKARVIVPEAWLDDLGHGRGASWNPEREVYSALAVPPNAANAGITLNQFKIRVQEHSATAADLTAAAVRGAGYSMATFGEDADGGAVTATEIRERQARSYSTRGRKINYWRPALIKLANIMLQMDRAYFRTGVEGDGVAIEWPDGVSEHPETQARTLQLLETAEAVSTQTKVEMLHPDWTEEQVRQETARIQAEKGHAVPNPASFTGGDDGEADDE